MVRGALAADADVLAVLAAGADRHRQHGLHRGVALVEGLGHQAGIAVEPQGELREVVRADREAVEKLEELLGKQGVRRQLAHHDDAQAVDTSFQVIFFE